MLYNSKVGFGTQVLQTVGTKVPVRVLNFLVAIKVKFGSRSKSKLKVGIGSDS